jgi:hypothetical protein
MSLLKSVPEGLEPHECKRVKLCEPPPVPYIPTKDEFQDEVVKLRNLEIKTSIEKDTRLNFQVWCENGTREAFVMHVTAVLNAIKTRGHFYDYEKAAKDHKESIFQQRQEREEMPWYQFYCPCSQESPL